VARSGHCPHLFGVEKRAGAGRSSTFVLVGVRFVDRRKSVLRLFHGSHARGGRASDLRGGAVCTALLAAEPILVLDITPGDDRLRRGRFVGVVASRGPGRPRKTPGKTISADSHEFALAA
jgi:hypothetical protein